MAISKARIMQVNFANLRALHPGMTNVEWGAFGNLKRIPVGDRQLEKPVFREGFRSFLEVLWNDRPSLNAALEGTKFSGIHIYEFARLGIFDLGETLDLESEMTKADSAAGRSFRGIDIHRQYGQGATARNEVLLPLFREMIEKGMF